jgi:hypothetical protein
MNSIIESAKRINLQHEQMVDLVRQIMYGGTGINGDNLAHDIHSLGVLLGEIDGVPFNADTNRLCILVDALFKSYITYKSISG